MTGTTEPPKGKREATTREERLAAALRANLARRKAQGRARDAAPPPRDDKKQ